MPSRFLRAAVRQVCVLASAAAVTSFALSALAPSSTESAGANGDTRTLHLYHTHSHESIDATFRVDGHYDRAVLRQLNHFLRDWRNDEEHEMDPRLFDAVWEAYRTAGATDAIQIYSAYRSPQTNAMLRRRSRAVAEHSQHMLGKAMDTTMPGFPMSRIREAGMKLQHGGVGWYPSSNFVHLDVGSVRSWPRMSYDQLASIFPDGKTVHIASDGRTLPGYDQARIEIAQNGGVEPPAQESPGFFAWLFGNGGSGSASEGDEQERRAPAVAAPAPAPQPVQVARAEAPPPAAEPAQSAAQQDETAAPPALAYATSGPSQQQAQLVDARARADRQQVASLEPVAPEIDAPLPPRRPTDLAAAAEAVEIPLPPTRPAALDRMQTASIRYTDAQSPTRPDRTGDIIEASGSGVPMIRKSSLPSIITRGGRARPLVPSEVLAFASAESLPDMRHVPLPVARPANLAKPLALRGARRHPTVAVGQSVAGMRADGLGVSTGPVKLDGPKVMGLRRAVTKSL